jgi:cysteine desulfurase
MMTEDYIYLDYAASTPVDPRVFDRMRECSAATCANPSSTHAAGRMSQDIIANAATQVADLLNIDPKTLIWTSGATESDNLAIAGGARYRAHRGKHIVTMRTEHKAVTDMFDTLAKEGFVLFHVDAAQAVGKVRIDLGKLPVDLLSLTGHKFYGPKGIGALYIADRPGCHVEPILFGGGQQRRMRPGTLPTELVAGLGMTAEIAAGRIDDDLAHLRTLRHALWDGIRHIDGVTLNGDPNGFPGILNVSVDDIEGESLLLALEPLLVATGSACNSKSQEPSYVLRALGLTDLQAQSAIRFSVGRPTTMPEVEFAAGHYRAAIEKLRELAPEVVT